VTRFIQDECALCWKPEHIATFIGWQATFRQKDGTLDKVFYVLCPRCNRKVTLASRTKLRDLNLEIGFYISECIDEQEAEKAKVPHDTAR
jgi:hypothetical protein